MIKSPIVLLISLILSVNIVFAQTGEAVFKKNCAPCHRIGGGKLVGPDLSGIHNKRSSQWLNSFIKSSSKMISSGDADANTIFNEYLKLPMPDQNLTDAEIGQVLDHIRKNSGNSSSGAVVEEKFSKAQEDRGADYFCGTLTFVNKGPACNSCHSISDKRITAGGNLAKNLTSSYQALKSAGIKAILGAPPFPSMTEAYKNHALTQNEINDLTAFIKFAGNSPSNPVYGFFGNQFGLWGTLLFLLLNAIIVLRIEKSKRSSTNKEILKRQFKTY